QSNGHEPRPAPGHEERGLAERTVDAEGHARPTRIVRAGDRLDVGEGNYGPEVPTLAEDEARASDPMLRDQGGDCEQKEVGGEDNTEDCDREAWKRGGYGDGDHEEGDQPHEKEGAADDLGAAICEREPLRHRPGTRVPFDKGAVVGIRA